MSRPYELGSPPRGALFREQPKHRRSAPGHLHVRRARFFDLGQQRGHLGVTFAGARLKVVLDDVLPGVERFVGQACPIGGPIPWGQP